MWYYSTLKKFITILVIKLNRSQTNILTIVEKNVIYNWFSGDARRNYKIKS